MARATPGAVAAFYVSSRHIMAGLADSVLRLFAVQKSISKLSGLTARVFTLMDKLENPEILQLPSDPNNPPRFMLGTPLSFNKVSIFKPDGILLVKDLTFEVPIGTRIIITGENGCGKSSLFRVLRGLWPLAQGTIVSPGTENFYFLSQINFVPTGTLRSIIIYPQSVEDMRIRNRTDGDLKQVLQWAHLEDLEVNGNKPTFDTKLDWGVALSPGQRQRMAFARLLYHKPKYAILDECTNGVAPDVEVDLYNRCRSLDITVFSISHKLELKKLHDFELHYNGDDAGSYTFKKLN